ncbi:hypothetical protein [Streptococcus sp. GP0011]|jgi:hypothetical protein|uniref:hypothetical protein n=1 Tax=Streptococcus sp. GP0011 TaxID=3063751 RepID=UPI0026E20EF9|nr:hypothetical protein [Streptococcus sp. GP0011]MDO6346589.1 hypothetical protein [Streptococcus sp. GP0011]
MIANIRVLREGNFEFLCELDIMKYSQEQVLERMNERGIDRDSFFICGITDWEVDKIMSLDEVYLLKKAVLELYDGDEFIVKFQLQHYVPVTQIATTYYRFCSKDEVKTMVELTKELDYESVINYFFRCGSWVTVFQGFIDHGEVLNTSQGFYRKVVL